jgi:SAM-dependent methyltransferase
MSQDWFASWFDTPYYHILYNHRDNTEAKLFIDTLFAHVKPHANAAILDLACGRGRHAIYMNKKGYSVTGVDLSDENIAYAKAFENERLHFEVRDMRKSMGVSRFDFVFNLFTSFGYFEQEKEDEAAMQHISACLKPGGTLVLDFMNTPKVAQNLVPQECKEAEGITFNINRYVEDEQIVKEITFFADGVHWRFEERVKKYTLQDFILLFESAGLTPVAYFGSLDLQPYVETESDRLIMLVKKP